MACHARLTTTVDSRLHSAHSKVRMSKPDPTGWMRTIHIGLWHCGHVASGIGLEVCGVKAVADILARVLLARSAAALRDSWELPAAA